MTIALKTGADDDGRRLDRILRKALPDHSLSLIHRLLRQGKALVNGKNAGPGERIPAGTVIQIVLQNEPRHAPRHCTPVPDRDSPSISPKSPPPEVPEILWRGNGVIVFNKPPGLASHGKDSLDTIVKTWLSGKLPPSLSFRPGPLHRLDKPTSGAIAFSENLDGARLFSRLLRERAIKKTYLAIVEGRISKDETWQDGLVRDTSAKKTLVTDGAGAKNAVTAVKPLAGNGSYTLIEAHLVTGRTHQIRSHAAAHGHPLAGDSKYGGHGFPGGFFLHAWKMEFTGQPAGFPHTIIAPLPESFLSRINILFGGNVNYKITRSMCR